MKMSNAKPFDIERVAYLSDEAFIHHCFVLAHRRVCSAWHVRYYMTLLSKGTSRREVAQSIFQDDEFTDQINTAALRRLTLLDGEWFLHQAYRKILGRPIDNSGLQNYLQSLSKGEDKLRILYYLATSPEGRARYALHPGLNEFAEFLTREYAPQGPIKLKDIVRLMALKDDEFVHKAYRVFLRRGADAAGLVTYQQALRNGLSKFRFLRSLAYSKEGRHFQKTMVVRLFLMLGRFV